MLYFLFMVLQWLVYIEFWIHLPYLGPLMRTWLMSRTRGYLRGCISPVQIEIGCPWLVHVRESHLLSVWSGPRVLSWNFVWMHGYQRKSHAVANFGLWMGHKSKFYNWNLYRSFHFLYFMIFSAGKSLPIRSFRWIWASSGLYKCVYDF